MSGRPPLRVGIVGLGPAGDSWAARSHLPALRATAGLRLVGCVASTPQSSRAAAEQHGLSRWFGSAEELAGSGEADLVVVSVRVPLHRQVIQQLRGHPVDILCEWPLGRDSHEATTLTTTAAASPQRSLVSLQGRHHPAFARLAEETGEGAIGDVVASTLVCRNPGWGPVVADRQLYLQDADNGATLVSISAGHVLDVVAHVLGPLSAVAGVSLVHERTFELDGGPETMSRTSPDRVALAAVTTTGVPISCVFAGGAVRPGIDWRIRGTRGEVVVTSQVGNLQHGVVDIHVGRRRIWPPPFSSPRVPETPMIAMYDAIRRQAPTVASFDEAAALHRLLDDVRAA
jgi:predicted dehydrogenase